jgi:hypothetical protein
MVDDFYQSFIQINAGKKLLALYYDKRGPKRSMTIPEVMTLNLLRIFSRIADLKTFHMLACENYRTYFPSLTNYENFLKASNRSIGWIAAFLQYMLFVNRMNSTDEYFYLDSTPVSVCENRYISSHMVCKAIASRGKSTKDWFYGFKLQGVCNEKGLLQKICFRPGSEHDSKAFNDMTKGMKGTFVTDAGYLFKDEDLKVLYMSGRKPCTATRKNMKCLMSEQQALLLRKRNCIENVWSVMKKNYNLSYHAARRVTGISAIFSTA